MYSRKFVVLCMDEREFTLLLNIELLDMTVYKTRRNQSVRNCKAVSRELTKFLNLTFQGVPWKALLYMSGVNFFVSIKKVEFTPNIRFLVLTQFDWLSLEGFSGTAYKNECFNNGPVLPSIKKATIYQPKTKGEHISNRV